MERLEESGELLRRTGSQARTSAKAFFEGFSDFALRDNVLEVAVGLIVASNFNNIVNSLVSDIILPPFSLLPFLGRNIQERFSVLRPGPNYEEARGYNTIAQAQQDGAVVMAWGAFVDRIINFLVVVFCLFIVARVYQWFSHDTVIKRMVKCKYCRKRINVKAKRCINCTSWQDGREEKQGNEESLL